jgi:uroporphyrinogen III methyltransferase/synthase
LWFAFTSPAGVDIFFDKLKKHRIDTRKFYSAKFAAVGSATAAVLEKHGIFPDLVPDTFSVEALGRALAARVEKGGRVLLLRAARAPDDIAKILEAAGIDYQIIPLYDTILETADANSDRSVLLAHILEGLDWITFTSASTVEGFAALVRRLPGGLEQFITVKALCIGEQTQRCAEQHGFTCRTSPEATLESMVETLKNEQ